MGDVYSVFLFSRPENILQGFEKRILKSYHFIWLKILNFIILDQERTEFILERQLNPKENEQKCSTLHWEFYELKVQIILTTIGRLIFSILSVSLIE